eukprot:4011212-Prymnesium_polylepis.1
MRRTATHAIARASIESSLRGRAASSALHLAPLPRGGAVVAAAIVIRTVLVLTVLRRGGQVGIERPLHEEDSPRRLRRGAPVARQLQRREAVRVDRPQVRMRPPQHPQALGAVVHRRD